MTLRDVNIKISTEYFHTMILAPGSAACNTARRIIATAPTKRISTPRFLQRYICQCRGSHALSLSACRRLATPKLLETVVTPPSRLAKSPDSHPRRGLSSDVGDVQSGLILHPKLSLFDNSSGWEEWFDTDDYSDVWSDEDFPPLDGGRSHRLDVETRHLLNLLDEEADGLRRSKDRPTTLMCNKAIRGLYLSRHVRNGRGTHAAKTDLDLGMEAAPYPSGRAARAESILRRMERCAESYLFRRDRGEGTYHAPPAPDRHTYWHVLRLYSEEGGCSAKVAERAEAIIGGMSWALQRYHGLAEGDGEGGAIKDELRPINVTPNAAEWNQVVKCWAGSADPDRALRAAAVLQQIKGGVGGKVGAGTVDATTYEHVFRACALSNDDVRLKLLGAQVALRVWSDYSRTRQSPSDEPQSRLYAFFFRACGNLPKGHRDTRKRDWSMEVAFNRCRKEGASNWHVIQQLRQAAPTKLMVKLLGEEGAKRAGAKF